MDGTTAPGAWWEQAWMTGRRGRGGRRGHGWGHGFGPAGGPPWMRGAGFPPFGGPAGRRGRGDVRLAVLGLLAEEPMHGYQLIREVAQRSRGSWRISPGSVYPTLSQLEDEGLVTSDDSGGRRSFDLTAAGRAEVATRADEYSALWAEDDDVDTQGWQDLAGLLAQVGAAAMQVGSEGSEVQRERAAVLLEDTRRSLYRLLADDEEES